MSDTLGTDVPEGITTPPNGDGLVLIDNTGAQRTPVQQVTPVESISGWINFSSQNVNIALEDAYTGGGGFLGNTDQDGFYSYLVAKLTENFYLTRVALYQYVNFFAPYIDAKVDPVFSIGVSDYAYKGEVKEALESDQWLDFVNNATGTVAPKSLNELRISESRLSWRDGVSYIIMDRVISKKTGKPRTVEYYEKALNVDSYTVDPTTQDLESITFWKKPIAVEDGRKVTGYILVKHKWEAGFLTVLHSKQVSNTVRDNTIEFTVHKVAETGIDVLNVYPMFSEPAELGDYKPNRPRSFAVARVCCNIYVKQNLLAYLMFKQGHGLYVFQGKLEGMRDALSNFVTIPSGTPSETINMPQILSPDADIPLAHLEIIKEDYAEMVSIMGNNGVSVVEKEAQSGASKSYDMIGTNQTNLKTVVMNQAADVWRKEMFDLFEGRPANTYLYETVYPKDFNPTSSMSIGELIELAEFYIDHGQYEAATEIGKLLATMALDEMSRDKVAEVLEGIEIVEEPNDAVGNNGIIIDNEEE